MKKNIFILLLISTQTLSQAQITLKKTEKQAINTSFSTTQNLQFFMKIDGIDGECKDSQHLNWIRLEDFEFTIIENANGKTENRIKLYKKFDKSSGSIARNSSNNTNTPKIEIEVTGTINNRRLVLIKFVLENIKFQTYTINGDEMKGLIEIIDLQEQRSKINYYTYDAAGNLVSSKEIDFGYDY